MLRTLHIRNLAVIEALEIEFDAGMTVLTGETGAGKSILIDSLALVLGDRADTEMIRPGAAQADISAEFGIEPGGPAAAWLAEHDLAGDEDGCLLRRSISSEGRSKAYINGQPVPVQSLRALGDLMLDIHGQHAHQSLLKHPVQMQLLDAYGGHQAGARDVAATYRQWRTVKEELVALSGDGRERAAQIELLQYQVQELVDAALEGEGEVAALEQEHQRLAHARQLLGTSQQALDEIDEGEQPVADRLAHLQHELAQAQRYDSQLRPAVELLEAAGIQLREAAAELRRYLDTADSDPERLAWVERRLSQLYDLGRKHRVPPEGLFTHLRDLHGRLAALEGSGLRAGELEARLEALSTEYQRQAQALSEHRLAAAQSLARKVTRTIRDLGIPEGRFEVEFEPLPPGQPAEGGLERVEYLVATGARMPLRPLAKVASGGELSRISLAIQAITAQKDGAPTLIFDEVDVGIGGRVAEIVGKHLRALARHRQIICVTHLPQVAALTHHHHQVSKQSRRGVAVAQVRRLSDRERQEEIARMLGGVEITDQTRAHAAEMLARGRERA